LPEKLGQFDVVIVGSVLEHLSDQVTALASIARLAKDLIVINTPYVTSDDRLAQFAGSANNPQHDYTWWFYSLGTYRELFAMLGFSIERVTWHTYLNACENQRRPRATLVAKRIP
jgi:hypothetical protein